MHGGGGQALEARRGLWQSPHMTVSYPDTYYAANANAPPPRPALFGEVKTDVVVVGGGFTGTSAALTLAQSGVRAVLLEGDRIGYAASGRNGGQIHGGFRWEQEKFEKHYGRERAHRLFQLAEGAKALVRSRARELAIDCDLRDGLVIAAHNPRMARALSAEVEHLNSQYNYSAARYLNREEAIARTGSPIYHGALADAGGGHLHPLKYVLGTARAAEAAGAMLHEDSRVLALETTSSGVVARTANGRVVAGRAIVACDAFIEHVLPGLARYIAPVESHILGTAPLSDEQRRTVLPQNDAVADTRFVLDYYRLSADGRMLFSGGERFTRPAKDMHGLVRPRMEYVFPQLKGIRIDYAWAGTVGVTSTRLPHFGWANDHVLFGYGYSGHGVALANMGGKALADAAMGKTENFDLFASLKPVSFPGGALFRRPLTALALKAMTLRDRLP